MKLRTSLIIASGLVLGGIGLAPLVAQVLPQPGPPVPIACAYNTSPVVLTDGQAGWTQCTNDGKLQVNATVSTTASVTGFPGSSQTTGTPFTAVATAGGTTGTLPSGTVVLATNDGATNTAYCKLGASATVSDIPIYPHSSVALTVGSATQLTCITSTSTTSVSMTGGSGLPTGWGGGSASGGGGGGAITAASGSYASGALSSGSVASGAFASGALASGSVASGAMVDLGAVADAASTAGGTGTLSAKLRLMTTQLGSLTLAQGSTTSGQTGNLIQGAVTTSSPSYTTAQTSPLSLDTSGNLRVNVVAGGAGGGAVTVADGADVTQGANADAAATAGSTGTISAKLRLVTSQLGTIATNTAASVPAGTALIGYTSNDVCTTQAKTNLPISFQATASAQLIALSGSTKIYVCSLSLIASAATVFSITGGTGSNCGTPAALIGTTVAAHGLSLAANGGLTLGNGAGTVAVTAAGSELCIVQTGSGDLVGNLTYVQQ